VTTPTPPRRPPQGEDEQLDEQPVRDRPVPVMLCGYDRRRPVPLFTEDGRRV
jgi:hypothetical protein